MDAGSEGVGSFIMLIMDENVFMVVLERQNKYIQLVILTGIC